MYLRGNSRLCTSGSFKFISGNFWVWSCVIYRVFFSFLVVFELVLFFSSVMTRCSFEMRTTRNDLWALGCTLYQMLSGTSPFKDASEWLIFQRIVARDIRFPNYFSEAAQDLIDKLLARNTKPHCYLFPLCFIPTFQLFFCKFASESFIFA